MQLLVVRTSGVADRVFELLGVDVAIGRTRDADLFLNSQTISRDHALLTWEAGAYRIDDRDSHNGVWVNGEQVQGCSLKSGDDIRLGEYEIVYVDGPLPRKHRKLDIVAMDHWHQVTWKGTEEHTSQLSIEAMKRLVGARTHLEIGTLVGSDDRWLLSEKPWTLGRSGRIPVSGAWWVPLCAEVRWNGRNHVLRRLSGLVAIRVNGTRCASSCVLEENDEIRVGRSRFHYSLGAQEE